MCTHPAPRQLTLTLGEHGTDIEVCVQRKLPKTKPLGAQLSKIGPGAAIHQSGEHHFERSGSFGLERPLARDGTHSYLTEERPRRFVEELQYSDLEDRGDLDDAYVESHSVLYISIFLESKGVPRTLMKRKTEFCATPEGSPLRPTQLGRQA